MTQELAKPLSITNVLKQTLLHWQTHRLRLLHSLKYPGLGILLLSIITPNDEKSTFVWLLLIPEIYFYIIFTVQCHRAVLISEFPNNPKSVLVWKDRNTHFLISSFAMGAVAGVLFVVPSLMAEPIVSSFPDSTLVNYWVIFTLLLLPSGYVVSRISLILPSVAVQNDDSFFDAWKISSKNGWRLFLLIALTPWLLNLAITQISSDIMIIKIIASFLNLAVLTLGIMLLSYSYKEPVVPGLALI